jgi:LuxR family maltose regulon positive regulatory protein
MVALRRGDSVRALSEAGHAVRVASDAGMMRVIVDLGVAARPLLMLLAKQVSVESDGRYIEGVIRSISAGLEPAGQPTASESVSENTDDGGDGGGILSQREREVLALLSRALSTKSIARVLSLSSGTVKWHLKNIYAKLDATAREDALAKARALGIIR